MMYTTVLIFYKSIRIRLLIVLIVAILIQIVNPSTARAGSINIIIYNESMRNWNHEFLHRPAQASSLSA
jgi:hypothetical protein